MKTFLQQFFFKPAFAHPLALLRICISVCLLYQAFSISNLVYDLYGRMGIMQGPIQVYFSPLTPTISLALSWMGAVGISDGTGLSVLGGIYICSLFMLMIGFKTRVFAFLSWLLHMMFTQGNLASYGVDSFAHIFLFYLMCFPCGHAWSVDVRLNPALGLASPMARFGLRVCQLHLAIAYLASGLEKSVGVQWWNGEAVWLSVMLPIYNQYDFGWLAQVPWIAMLAGWGTLVVESLYPIFIFPRKTRPFWIAMIVSMHIGIIIFLGLHMFGALMACLSISLFAVSAEKPAALIELWPFKRFSLRYPLRSPTAAPAR